MQIDEKQTGDSQNGPVRVLGSLLSCEKMWIERKQANGETTNRRWGA